MPERDRKALPADDLLVAYELGLLEPDDRARVEAALLADPDLLEELYDAAPSTALLLSDPRRFAAAARAGLDAAAMGPRRGRLVRWLAGWRRPRVLVPAMGLAVMAMLLLWPGRHADPNTTLAVLEPLPAPRVELRSTGGSGADAAYADGVEAYREQTWDHAARSFAEASSLADPGWARQHQARLFEGSSLLLGGQPERAVGPLDAASASPLPPIREQALWQLAQARLTLGDKAAARTTLASLVASPVFGVRATALLDQLGTGGT